MIFVTSGPLMLPVIVPVYWKYTVPESEVPPAVDMVNPDDGLAFVGAVDPLALFTLRDTVLFPDPQVVTLVAESITESSIVFPRQESVTELLKSTLDTVIDSR